jgi:hypothetical protein
MAPFVGMAMTPKSVFWEVISDILGWVRKQRHKTRK